MSETEPKFVPSEEVRDTEEQEGPSQGLETELAKARYRRNLREQREATIPIEPGDPEWEKRKNARLKQGFPPMKPGLPKIHKKSA